MNTTMVDKEIIDVIIKAATDTANVSQIYLFGSRAKGLARDDSDYDIYIVINDNENTEPLDILFGFKMKTRKKTKMHAVDVLTMKESRFAERANSNTFERTILNEGILLYRKQ
jgi:predicted nucleotidyltransferase